MVEATLIDVLALEATGDIIDSPDGPVAFDRHGWRADKKKL